MKPIVKLTGENSNVFNLLGICTKALKKAGMFDEAKKLTDEVFNSASFDDALQIMMKYVEAN